MNLEVWPGDWGLPSVDSKCLETLAFMKICGAEVQIIEANNPLRSPSREFPVLQDGDTKLTSFEDILIYLKKKNFNPDFHLSPRQCADSLAFTNLLQDRLEPALWLCWWVDAKNSTELTRKWYASHLRFPLNFYYPSVWEAAAKKKLESVCDFDASASAVEAYVCRRADECFATLSEQLGERDWFLGGVPCSLDARVFGYLAPLLRAPLPSARLQTLLKAHHNLVSFVTRMQLRYFAKEYAEHEAEQKRGAAGRPAADAAVTEEDAEFPNKRRNQLLAALVAAAATLTFALASGIVKIENLEPDDFELSELDAD